MQNYLTQQLKALPFFNEVSQNNGKIYAVGGPVRDLLLQKKSKDLDIIITGIDYDKLSNILQKYGNINLVGQSFGIIKFKETPQSEEIDIALPRTEKKSGKGYQGFEVSVDPNMSIEEEMKRRDITINALAMDSDGNIIDPFGGVNDIRNKVIKATSPNSFSEDPLRMLRCIQFSSRFGFSIDSKTEQMIKDNAALIKEISPERYIIEFDKIITKGKPEIGIRLLVQLGLFGYIFGFQYKGDFNNFDKVHSVGEFFALCSKGIYENMTSPVDLVVNLFKKRFGSALDNDTLKILKGLILYFSFKGDEVQRLFMLSNLHKIYPKLLTDSELIIQSDKQLASRYPLDNSELDISGQELLNLGFKGKEVGEAITKIFSAIYSNTIPNRKKEILEFINPNNNPNGGEPLWGIDKEINETITPEVINLKNYIKDKDIEKYIFDERYIDTFQDIINRMFRKVNVYDMSEVQFKNFVNLFKQKDNDKYNEALEEFKDMLENYSKSSQPSKVLFKNRYKIVKNEWLVHYTDKNSANDILQNGFKVGIPPSLVDKISYTGNIEDTDKTGGFNYALKVSEMSDDKYAYNDKYGYAAVVFIGSGIEIYHPGDKENQVIFWGNSVRNMVIIYFRLPDNDEEEYGHYIIKSKKRTKLIKCSRYANSSENRNKLIKWVVKNYRQYKLIDEEVTAYHGTPHDFDKFSTDKIGTGEGSQSFGWGLYFTSKEDIAKNYAKMNIGWYGNNLPIINNINKIFKSKGINEYDKFDLIDFADTLTMTRDFKSALKQLEKWSKHDKTGLYKTLFNDLSKLNVDETEKLLGTGNLYKVTIHRGKTPDQYTWLNWYEKVPNNLKPKIIQTLKDIQNYSALGLNPNEEIQKDIDKINNNSIVGQAAYSILTVASGDESGKSASLGLLKNGIDGIRYPSGTLSGIKDSDAYNYVVFDPKAIEIQNKQKLNENYNTQTYLKNETDNVINKFVEYFQKYDVNYFGRILSKLYEPEYSNMRLNLYSFQIQDSLLSGYNVFLTCKTDTFRKNNPSGGEHSFNSRNIQIYINTFEFGEIIKIKHENPSQLREYIDSILNERISHELFHGIEAIKSNGKFNQSNKDYLIRPHEIRARFASAINQIPFVVKGNFIDWEVGFEYVKEFIQNYDELPKIWQKNINKKYTSIWKKEKDNFLNGNNRLNIMNETLDKETIVKDLLKTGFFSKKNNILYIKQHFYTQATNYITDKYKSLVKINKLPKKGSGGRDIFFITLDKSRINDFNTGQLNLFEDNIKGGKSDNMSLSDIAKHHNVSLKELTIEFKKGIKTEKEHTSNYKVAMEIAKDHLYENPEYYTKLQKAGLADELDEELTAYHGTQANFRKFNNNKIGTGEGNQTFGWGLYFTDKEDIAKTYARSKDYIFTTPLYKTLDKEKYIKTYVGRHDDLVEIFKKGKKYETWVSPNESLKDPYKIYSSDDIGDIIDYTNNWINNNYDIDGDIEWYDKKYNQISNESIFKKTNQYVYSVKIHQGKTPDQYIWLDWYEKPSQTILNKIKTKYNYILNVFRKSVYYNKEKYPDNILYQTLDGIFNSNNTNKSIYNDLVGIFGSPKEASLFLLRAGIDGIRYPSGSLSGIKDSDAYNYVVFDPRAVTVVNKQKINETKKLEESFKYEYGCVMLKTPFKKWSELTSLINPEDVYDDADNNFGIEKDPHITLLFGLHSDEIDMDEVKNILDGYKSITYKITGVSYFETKDGYDVVKLDVISDVCAEINKKLSKLPATITYPEYKPHITLSYVKPGEAKKYEVKFQTPLEFTSNEIEYSVPIENSTDKKSYNWKLLTESNKLNEYSVSPYELTDDKNNQYRYEFKVGDIDYVLFLFKSNKFKKNVYEFQFIVKNKLDFDYKTNKDTKHFNNVMYTIGEIIKTFKNKYHIDGICYQSTSSRRTDYYDRFFKNNFKGELKDYSEMFHTNFSTFFFNKNSDILNPTLNDTEDYQTQDVINEVIDTYNPNFNIDEFNKLTSFNSRKKYCDSVLQRIGTGSSRITYNLNPTTVLKLAWNKKGLTQNEVEAATKEDYYLHNSGILAKVYDYSDDYQWVISEKAFKLTPKIFKEITGVSFETYKHYINDYFNLSDDEEYLHDNEFLYGVNDLIRNYNMMPNDFLHLPNLGYVIRDNEKEVVIIDYGFNNKVYTNHYMNEAFNKITKNSDIKIKYHKTLNPKFWDGDKLKTDIKDRLLEICEFYIKENDIDVDIKDIIFTGSLCNYNYTDLSDVDLHIVIDYKDVNKDTDLVFDYFIEKKNDWSVNNKIKILDYPIELFVQDISQTKTKGMSAIYSLKNDEWVKKPKYSVPSLNFRKLVDKANEYISEFKKIEKLADSNEKLNKLNKLSNEIKSKRHKATAKKGEFSEDNIVFKILRNKNIIKDIKTLKNNIISKIFTLK